MRNPILFGLLGCLALFSTLLAMLGLLGLNFGEALFVAAIILSSLGQFAFRRMLAQDTVKGHD